MVMAPGAHTSVAVAPPLGVAPSAHAWPASRTMVTAVARASRTTASGTIHLRSSDRAVRIDEPLRLGDFELLGPGSLRLLRGAVTSPAPDSSPPHVCGACGSRHMGTWIPHHGE